MTRILIVSSSRSGGTAALVDAVRSGLHHPDLVAEGLAPEVVDLDVTVAGPDDVLAADGIVVATPARFGGLAGLTRDFFERIYHPCLDRTRGRPWGLVVRGTTDASGAVRDAERIVTGLAWRAVLPPLVIERGTAGATTQPPLSTAEQATALDWAATFAAALTTLGA